MTHSLQTWYQFTHLYAEDKNTHFIGMLSNTLATSYEELTHWKRPWCWEDWGQEEKGMTEDEMAGWHHRLNGYEFEWTLGVGDGQGGLACCDSWGRRESDTTEQNWTELMTTNGTNAYTALKILKSNFFLYVFPWCLSMCVMWKTPCKEKWQCLLCWPKRQRLKYFFLVFKL